MMSLMFAYRRLQWTDGRPSVFPESLLPHNSPPEASAVRNAADWPPTTNEGKRINPKGCLCSLQPAASF